MTAPTASRLSGHGLGVSLPRQWEGRIFRRGLTSASASPGRTPTAVLPAPIGWSGEQSMPILHLANFPLPAERGDYGTGAVEQMTERDIFIAVLEFGQDCVGTALYAPQGLPQPTPGQFDPNGLQRRISGQAGFQRFCTVSGRPLAVYAVIGSHRLATTLCPQVNAVLSRIEVSPR